MTETADKPTPKESLRDRILAERKAGNVVFWGLPGELRVAKIDEFVQQPAEGILYDLNRLEEISLTFLQDPKWVNDFAVALTIRKLVDQWAEALAMVRWAREEFASMPHSLGYAVTHLPKIDAFLSKHPNGTTNPDRP